VFLKHPQKLPQAKRGLAAAFELPQPSVVLDQKLLQDFVVSPLLSQRFHLMLLAGTKAPSQLLRIESEDQD
jgi:hypothetical protein